MRLQAILGLFGLALFSVQNVPRCFAASDQKSIAPIGTCVTSEDFDKEYQNRKGITLLSLDGQEIWNVGSEKDVDEGVSNFEYRFIIYSLDGQDYWSLTRFDQPSNKQSEKKCVEASGESSSAKIADPRSATAILRDGFTFDNKEAALKSCNILRKAVRERLDRKFVDLKGEPVRQSSKKALEALDQNRDTMALELQNELDDRKAASTGDNLCTFHKEKLASDGACRLIGQFVGVDRTGIETLFSLQICFAGNWKIFATLGSGASISWADGKSYQINDAYFDSRKKSQESKQ